MNVLVTGAAGNVGTVLARGFEGRHRLRGFDFRAAADYADAVVGDIGDLAQVQAAAQGMDAIIHLVNVPGGEWEHSLQNMAGTHNVFEAARLCGVPRVVYASRGGILPQSFYPRTLQRTVDMLPKPDSFYTISKVCGESLAYMYSARHGIGAVAVRIGNFKLDRDLPEHPHHLSHGDCVRVFEQAISHPGVKFEVVFGVSDSDWPLYDLEHGRKAIGYCPQDKSHVPEEERQ